MFSILHEQALAAAGRLKRAEAELVGLLIRIEDCGGFRDMGYPSLYVYVQKGLRLSESCAQQLIYVSRKCREVPALLETLEAGTLTVSKAKIVVPVLERGNQEKWIRMAIRLPARALERLVAARIRRRPSGRASATKIGSVHVFP